MAETVLPLKARRFAVTVLSQTMIFGIKPRQTKQQQMC